MTTTTTTRPNATTFSELLVDAINKPGSIMQAYSAFTSYSIGNQLLALFQCHFRGLPPGRSIRFLAGRISDAP